MADSWHFAPSASTFFLVENFTFVAELCQEKELMIVHQ
jgi:hypothetical protein